NGEQRRVRDKARFHLSRCRRARACRSGSSEAYWTPGGCYEPTARARGSLVASAPRAGRAQGLSVAFPPRDSRSYTIVNFELTDRREDYIERVQALMGERVYSAETVSLRRRPARSRS